MFWIKLMEGLGFADPGVAQGGGWSAAVTIALAHMRALGIRDTPAGAEPAALAAWCNEALGRADKLDPVLSGTLASGFEPAATDGVKSAST